MANSFLAAPEQPPTDRLLWPLKTVLSQTSISRSGWLAGVKDGRYPSPVRLSPRRVAWRVSDICKLVTKLETASITNISEPSISLDAPNHFINEK